MTLAISPTQSNVQAALAAFLQNVTGLVVGDTIISGQGNRASEPSATTFVVMTPIRFTRLETNLDEYADVQFTASIAGTSMVVTDVAYGLLMPGAIVFGPGVAVGTSIVSGPGAGGTGTYVVSQSQTVPSQTMACGAETLTQGAEVTVQLDFHSADLTAGDLAQAVSTAFRDEYGTTFFAGLDAPLDGIVPLYADDPVQRPFLNAEQQYEWRWVLEARLQANQVVSVPQQFLTSAKVTPKSVTATFPP
jgi:hypothetical protein